MAAFKLEVIESGPAGGMDAPYGSSQMGSNVYTTKPNSTPAEIISTIKLPIQALWKANKELQMVPGP
jgi:hypothetical protein